MPSSRSRSTVAATARSEEHTSELQSYVNLVCRLLLEKKKERLFPSSSVQGELDTTTQPIPLPPAACVIYFISNFLPSTGGPTENHVYFFFNDTATTEIYTLSLHDALPI